MATRKPKQEKSAAPIEGKAPDNEIKVKKQTRAGKETSTKKKTTTTRKVKSQVKPVEKNVTSTTQKEVQPETKRAIDKEPMLLGAGLLIMGLLLLAGRFLHIPFSRFLWPFIFIVPGALVFLSALSTVSDKGEGLSIVGGILGTLGIVFLMQTVTGLWASWAYIWALVAPTSIGVSQMVYGNLKNRETIAETGWKLTKIGFTIFFIGFVFFELILGISGFGLARFGLPVFPMILIFVGVFVLVRSLFRAK